MGARQIWDSLTRLPGIVGNNVQPDHSLGYRVMIAAPSQELYKIGLSL